MLKRLKRSLVESYVGAIALGWIFAQSIFYFAGALLAPFTAWISRNEYQRVAGEFSKSQGPLLQDALTSLARSFALLLLGYLLLRWLYFKPIQEESIGDVANPEQPATSIDQA